MIVVVGRVRTDADRRAELIRLGQQVAQASRAEAGCLGYRLYEDTENENDFVFIEDWESEEALREHFATPHFATPHIAAFMAAFPATLSATPDVKFHTVAGTRDLTEISGSR
ncbi:MAG: antibiotic biosynthesis monooxygenase [Actinomycetota bacterium]|nr:antibiotic biosynthesis monooxygenase [Actinomycetota bacterium]